MRPMTSSDIMLLSLMLVMNTHVQAKAYLCISIILQMTFLKAFTYLQSAHQSVYIPNTECIFDK
jgi:hypothetical protein